MRADGPGLCQIGEVDDGDLVVCVCVCARACCCWVFFFFSLSDLRAAAVG